MDVAALTFRAEKEMIEAIRAYSAERGQSVNAALKEIIAPVVDKWFIQTHRHVQDVAIQCIR